MKRRNWTQEDIEYLCEHWGEQPVSALAKKLNRSKSGVINKVNRLGLAPYLESGGYISLFQLIAAVNGKKTGYTDKVRSWSAKGLPIVNKRINKNTWRVVYLKDFWLWAEKHRSFIDFSDMEPLALGEEPQWVVEQRRKDYAGIKKQKKWTSAEESRLIHLVKQQKYTYGELAEIMHRTDGAIQRRLLDLNIKDRPLRAKERLWKEEEHQIVIDGIKNGDSYMAIAQRIGRSEKGVRGHVYQTSGSEVLDKVRVMVGNGQWGDGAPNKRAAESAGTLTTAEDKPHITSKPYHDKRRISSAYL